MNLQVDVLSWDNQQVIGQMPVSEWLATTEVKPHLLSEVIRWQLACRRSGTHMTKTKGLVRGGGKKPFRQKGTGNARQGSIRSPLMPGGGKIFGPVPRSYAYELPKKMRRAALRMAIRQALDQGRLKIFDQVVTDGKTKFVAQKLKKLGLEKALLLGNPEMELVERSVRNLPNAKFLTLNGVNVFDILKYQNIVMSQQDFKNLEAKIGGEA